MESNLEHYKDEILTMFLLSEDKCKFYRNKVLKPDTCLGVPCEDCRKRVKEWLQQPYEEPVIEIDWPKVPVDTPVIVIADSGAKVKRHFAEYFNGRVYTFNGGATSWSVAEKTTSYITAWDKVELAREEDVEKYKK